MAAIKNAAPRFITHGFNDQSGRALPVEPEEIPQHLPLFYFQSKRGPMTPQLGAGRALMDTYGAESFDPRSKFYSHQTMGLTICNGNANAVMAKRVVAANARRAGFVLFLDITKVPSIPVYQRNSDNSVVRDSSNVKQIDAGAAAVPGWELTWSVRPVTDMDNLAGEVSTGVADAMSYPVFAFACGYGEYGNNVGVRFSCPGPASADPVDSDIIINEGAMLYRAQFVERADSVSLPTAINSLNAETAIDFALKPGVVNSKTDQDLGAGRLLDEYQSIDPSTGLVPTYGPFEDIHVYHDNVTAITEALMVDELAAFPGSISDAATINIFSALDTMGDDYHAIRIDGSGVSLNTDTTHYAVGGADGDVSEAVLDTLVATELTTNWENPEYPLQDTARYPFSVLYDTGFTIETKKKLIGTLGMRPDISVAVCTQDILEAPNTVAEETSVMTALRSHARLTPESTMYGTPVARCVVMGQVGKKSQSTYPRNVPVITDLIEKRSKYMGAGNGKYKREFAYDVAPANRITTMTNVTHAHKPQQVRSNDWELGLNWAQYADRRQLFFPAIQTVYDNDTSVLNNDINMLIAVDVTKMAEEVWRQLTGNTTLTNAQFIDRANELMSELVADRYDNRVTIIPNTYFTAADEARGYSWTMDVAIYMNNMRTVGVFNIISRRSSDLETGV